MYLSVSSKGPSTNISHPTHMNNLAEAAFHIPTKDPAAAAAYRSLLRRTGSASSSSSGGRSFGDLAAAAQLQLQMQQQQHGAGAGGGYPGAGFLGGAPCGPCGPYGGGPASMMAPPPGADAMSQLREQMSEQHRIAAHHQAAALRQLELENARMRAALPQAQGGIHRGAFGGYAPASAHASAGVGPGPASRLPSDYSGDELHSLWKQDMLLREAAMMRGPSGGSRGLLLEQMGGRESRDLLLEQMAAAEAAESRRRSSGSEVQSAFSGIGPGDGPSTTSRENLAELYSRVRQSQVDGLSGGEHQGGRRPAAGRSMLGRTLEVATKLPPESPEGRGGARQDGGSMEVTDDAPPSKLVRKKRSDSCSSFDALLSVFGDELAQFDREEKEKLASELAAGKVKGNKGGGGKSKKKKGQKKGQKRRKGDKGAATPDRGSPVRPAKKSKRSGDGNAASSSSPAAATPDRDDDDGSRRPSAGSTLFTVDINAPPSRPPSNFSLGMQSTSAPDLGGSVHHAGGGAAGQYQQGGPVDPAVASIMLANLRSREAERAAREAAILHEMQARGAAADLHHHHHGGGHPGLHYHQLLLQQHQQHQHQLGGCPPVFVGGPPFLGGYRGDVGAYRGFVDAAPMLSVLHAPPDPSRPDPTREWMLATLESLGQRRRREGEDAGAGDGRRGIVEVHHDRRAEVEDEYEEEEEESDPPEVQLQAFLDEYGDEAVKSRERLLEAVDETEKSQSDLHDWDRSRGLRKCHSRTVVKTRRSRACLVAFLSGKAQPRKARPRVQKRKREPA